MELPSLIALIYLLVFSVYHVLQGIISVFFPDAAIKFNIKLYGYKPKETEQLKMNFKPWGSLALTVGVIGLMIASNLELYSLFLWSFVALLGLRIGYRIIFSKLIYGYWEVTPWQNWRTILIQIVGIILFIILFINYSGA